MKSNIHNPNATIPKTLVLALGNPILSDDGVAWEIADRLAHRATGTSTDILKESAATLDLVPRISQYERLIVIDAIQLGTAAVGTVHRLSLADLRETIHLTSAHDLNFASAFAVGEKLGYPTPREVQIFGVEVKELRRFADTCTREVADKLDVIAEEIGREIFAAVSCRQRVEGS
ncbi:MAG: hydrogenase maturation protease [Phycisphaerae bacterium]|nr:hydrogenase maturation protease [Phycisphaerae bacterium]